MEVKEGFYVRTMMDKSQLIIYLFLFDTNGGRLYQESGGELVDRTCIIRDYELYRKFKNFTEKLIHISELIDDEELIGDLIASDRSLAKEILWELYKNKFG